MSTADEIDRLYQAPLGEFTAKRHELLKKAAGAAKNELRALQKPTLPAWAVNQLYWRRRRVFDRVTEAARKLRIEHGRQLSGKAAEVDLAEARHRDAIKAASDEIRALLKDAGEQDTPATMTAVAETLQGLPGRDDHGRLVRPLKPQGFEALAGLVTKSSATIARLSSSGASGAAGPAGSVGSDRATQKKETQARAKETAALERQLRRAESEERAARAEVSRAEMALARLQRERKEFQARVDDVTSRRDQAAIQLDERRRQVERATAERVRLGEKLRGMKHLNY